MEFEISYAEPSHKKELVSLWAEAFGDGEEYVLNFLAAHMGSGLNVPIARSNGELLAALYLIELPLYSNSQKLGSCSYLFAAATKKTYQNQGIMSALVSHSVRLCKNRGQKAIFLFPQSGPLFDFYSRFGFETFYMAKKLNFCFDGEKKGGSPELSLNKFNLNEKSISEPDTFEELYAAYEKLALAQPLSPLKDRRFYRTCAASYLDILDILDVAENIGTAAHFAAFERLNEHATEKICYVFYKKYKNNYYIDDIIPLGQKNDFESAAKLLAGFLSEAGAKSLELTLPPSSPADSRNAMAMILPLSGEIENIMRKTEPPPYLNLFMNE
ncbi:MAG: GNAT family N-acetyltransferase [Oscillospiraceae bacterium]|nr:GNAT family N-acetyltransferase [Oscillospiraceae bacterium]